MAFVIRKKKTFFWPVVIKTPKDGGGYDEQKLNLEFKFLKDSELVDLVKKSNSDKELCKAIVVGWKDVLDEQEQPVSFESFEDVLDTAKFASSIVSQFLKIIGDIVEKN